MRRFRQVTEVLVNIASREFPMWLVFIIMCIIVVDVITRYILKSPLGISTEMGGYAGIAIVFMGLAYAWKEKSHIRVLFVVDMLPVKVRNWLRVVTLVMAAAVTVALIIGSFDLLAYSFSVGAKSGTHLNILLQWPRLVLPIGATLVFLQIIIDLIDTVRAIRTPKGEA